MRVGQKISNEDWVAILRQENCHQKHFLYSHTMVCEGSRRSIKHKQNL
jgi:hypothetical protein